jgi:hypothetical protein
MTVEISFLNQQNKAKFKSSKSKSMKNYLTIILFLISFAKMSNAQNYIHEFGKYSNEDFQLKSYNKDPAAEAVVIYDIGKSYFSSTDQGFELNFERIMKIKILSKAGLKWAEISVPYYQENDKMEEIRELKGNTYNLENGIVRATALNIKNTYNEKINDHWYEKKFAMPDVKEGSVIEISYKVRSPYLFNLRNWEFQGKIPVIYSEYTTRMIPFYEYTYLLQGASKFTDFKTYTDNMTNQFGAMEYHDVVYTFIMKDLPAFKDESFITSVNDYIVKLDFQLAAIHRPDGVNQTIMSTWQKLSDEMTDYTSFGKYLKSVLKKGKEITDTMKLDLKAPLEKAKIIDRFVKTNFNWNGNNDKYATKSVKEFLNSKLGNSCDVNLFLTGLLNSAGIEAYPVLISTRNHGKIKYDFPFLNFFNSMVVIAIIDNSEILLDATNPLCNFNEIPTRCLNEKGLMIAKGKVKWVDLKNTSVSSMDYRFEIKTNATNDSTLENCKLITSGYDALSYRNKYSASYNDLKSSLIGSNSISTDSVKALNLNKIEDPFELNYKRKTPVETLENKIIINPFCNTPITENPLKQPFRTYPVDIIYKTTNNFQAIITIPKGYKLLTMPGNLTINNGVFKIIYVLEMQGDTTVKVNGIYEFKKDIYMSSDYFDLKDAFNKIVDKFNERLIFVKNS